MPESTSLRIAGKEKGMGKRNSTRETARNRSEKQTIAGKQRYLYCKAINHLRTDKAEIEEAAVTWVRFRGRGNANDRGTEKGLSEVNGGKGGGGGGGGREGGNPPLEKGCIRNKARGMRDHGCHPFPKRVYRGSLLGKRV